MSVFVMLSADEARAMTDKCFSEFISDKPDQIELDIIELLTYKIRVEAQKNRQHIRIQHFWRVVQMNQLHKATYHIPCASISIDRLFEYFRKLKYTIEFVDNEYTNSATKDVDLVINWCQ